MEEIINLGNASVNNWLVTIDGRRVLVDTGYPEAWGPFTRRLAKEGLGLGDIDLLFLTHAHDDHAGFLAAFLAARPDLPVMLSPLARKGLARGQNGPGGGAPDKDALAHCAWMARMGKGAHRYPAITADQMDGFIEVTPENRAALEAAWGFRIVDLPGHTADSIGMLTPQKALFCGDAAQNGPPAHDLTTIWIGDLPTYVASWERMTALSPAMIYPGHGRPFTAQQLAHSLPILKTKTLYTPARRPKAK